MVRSAASAVFWNAFVWRNEVRPGLREIEQFGRLDPAARRRQMASALQSRLRYFASREDALPEWREAARITSPDDLWRQWPSLPIMTKRDLVSRFHPEEIQTRYRLRGKRNATGGSTGEPTHFFTDHDSIRAQTATTLYARLRMGWRPGMPAIAVWGSDRDLGKRVPGGWEKWKAELRNDFVVPGFRADSSTIDKFLHLLESRGPAAVFGYSSLLEFVAQGVLDRGISVPNGWVRVAWNGGEMLFDHQVELFQKAFGVPVFNLYGGRELSAMAVQVKAGGPLEVIRPFVFFELVDDSGRPAAPGETGRIIVTSTVGSGTPFLRYEIGDLAVADSNHRDESGIHSLRALEGRNSGLLKLPNGTTINCIYWNHTFKEFPEIRQFQIVVQGGESLLLRLAGSGMTGEREARFLDMLNLVTAGIGIGIEWVDSIPLTREGKLVQVVRQ